MTGRERRLRERIDTLTAERDEARDGARELRRRLTRTMDYLTRTRRSRDMWRTRCRDAQWAGRQRTAA